MRWETSLLTSKDLCPRFLLSCLEGLNIGSPDLGVHQSFEQGVVRFVNCKVQCCDNSVQKWSANRNQQILKDRGSSKCFDSRQLFRFVKTETNLCQSREPKLRRVHRCWSCLLPKLPELRLLQLADTLFCRPLWRWTTVQWVAPCNAKTYSWKSRTLRMVRQARSCCRFSQFT